MKKNTSMVSMIPDKFIDKKELIEAVNGNQYVERKIEYVVPFKLTKEERNELKECFNLMKIKNDEETKEKYNSLLNAIIEKNSSYTQYIIANVFGSYYKYFIINKELLESLQKLDWSGWVALLSTVFPKEKRTSVYKRYWKNISDTILEMEYNNEVVNTINDNPEIDHKELNNIINEVIASLCNKIDNDEESIKIILKKEFFRTFISETVVNTCIKHNIISEVNIVNYFTDIIIEVKDNYSGNMFDENSTQKLLNWIEDNICNKDVVYKECLRDIIKSECTYNFIEDCKSIINNTNKIERDAKLSNDIATSKEEAIEVCEDKNTTEEEITNEIKEEVTEVKEEEVTEVKEEEVTEVKEEEITNEIKEEVTEIKEEEKSESNNEEVTEVKEEEVTEVKEEEKSESNNEEVTEVKEEEVTEVKEENKSFVINTNKITNKNKKNLENIEYILDKYNTDKNGNKIYNLNIEEFLYEYTNKCISNSYYATIAECMVSSSKDKGDVYSTLSSRLTTEGLNKLAEKLDCETDVNIVITENGIYEIPRYISPNRKIDIEITCKENGSLYIKDRYCNILTPKGTGKTKDNGYYMYDIVNRVVGYNDNPLNSKAEYVNLYYNDVNINLFYNNKPFNIRNSHSTNTLNSVREVILNVENLDDLADILNENEVQYKNIVLP